MKRPPFLLILLSGLVVALFASLGPGRALAGTKEDAKRAFSHGMSLIEAGRYEEGIELLHKAYELKPHRNV